MGKTTGCSQHSEIIVDTSCVHNCMDSFCKLQCQSIDTLTQNFASVSAVYEEQVKVQPDS